ncbi:MAG: hypothetical protein L6R35_004371 [Caloplaca aegaea]|nr:MAG: hypothetical protein L6R35_004371 [Caloplaca aegaea]
MAAVYAASDLPASMENEWNEAEVQSALARLHDMHIQLRHLRDAIPRLIEPMLVHQRSPEDLYTTFATSVTTIRSDLDAFSAAYQEDRYQEVLGRAAESRAQNNEDIPAWKVTEHEDWLDVRKVVNTTDTTPDDGTTGIDIAVTPPPTADPASLRTCIERFKQGNPNIKVSLDEPTRKMKVALPPPAYVHFEIDCKSGRDQEPMYTVTTSEKTRMHVAITKAIGSRSQPSNLDHLLEMLASYVDIRSRKCSNCHRLLDPDAQFPVLRSKKKSKQFNGDDKLAWQAYHTSCS